MTLIDVVGYVASGLIVASLMMSSMLRLRLLNLAGSITFVGYGLLVGAWPVVASNGAIIVLNLNHLRRMRQADLIPADRPVPPPPPARYRLGAASQRG